MTSLCALVREANTAGDPVASLLAIGFMNLIAGRAVQLFYLDMLDRHSAAPVPLLRGPNADAIRNGKAPAAVRYIKALRAGPPKRRPIPSIIRYAYTAWCKRQTFPEKPFRLLDLNRDVVATTTNPLLSWHATISADPVFFVHHRQWFGPMAPESSARKAQELRGSLLIGEVVEIIQRSAAAVGEPLRAIIRDHLFESIVEGAALIQCHLDRAFQAGNMLPRKLWVGTGNGLWDRILGVAIKKVRGTTTVHDHGPGAGLRASHLKPILDFYIADVYATTSQGQAETLERNPHAELKLRSGTPEIRVLATMPAQQCGRAPDREKRPEKPVVLLVLQPLYGDDIRYFQPLPDPLVVPWTAELATRLQSWGYDVWIKPHPEFPLPERTFGDGVRVLTGFVEDYVNQVDKIVFDWPLTSSLKVITQSGIPAVFIDLKHIGYDVKAWELLKRRFAVVDADYDGTGMPQIDWENLRHALGTCEDLTDGSFRRYMFGAGEW